jgi:hypothetical protein
LGWAYSIGTPRAFCVATAVGVSGTFAASPVSVVQRKCATIVRMKTSTIPSVRVEPELRAEVESLLVDGETVSEFVEASVRATVLRRRNQAEFVARGMRSLDDARRTGDYVEADAVVQALQRKLDAARKRKPATGR